MSEREIALDTETTGLSPLKGHRVIEIGCVEMVNRIPTGKTYHAYINPQRDVPQEAFNVHGLSTEFLQDKPLFADIVGDFLAFIGKDTLVIHNADFDMQFLNAELTHHKRKEIPESQAFCTLKYARKTFPGSPASLDALCKRFNVDNSARTKHGALLDAELLAEMYLELMGGSQVSLGLGQAEKQQATLMPKDRKPLKPRPHAPSKEELEAHQAFLEKLTDPLRNKA